jgi:AAA-like domain
MNQPEFYQAGGSLTFQHPSYVSRESDKQLEQAIRNGKFCYVLNCRQMGKSSLAIRTLKRLKTDPSDEYDCCLIDLSPMSSESETSDTWYFSLADKIARKLKINHSIYAWWEKQNLSSPAGKFNRFIEEILLKDNNKNIVIFVDEIDSVRRLKFSTDDFFALIKSYHDDRDNQPEYQRLRFVLLGVDSPSSLIQNPNCTPFNIGTPIALQGFNEDQAKLLAKGFADRSDRCDEIIREVLKWTGGQPFLTQKLCELITKSTNINFKENPEILVKRISQSSIIDNWGSQDEPAHLRTIENRLLSQKELRIRLLRLYEKIAQYSRTNRAEIIWISCRVRWRT